VVVPLLAGAAITAAGLVWLARSSGVDLGEMLAAGPAERPSDPGGAEAPPREAVQPATRDVTPEGVTSGPVVTGPLLRAAPDPEAARAGGLMTTFRRVVVLDAVHFRTIRDRTPVVVRLDGVVGPAFSETCVDPSGTVWKCGARARGELSRFIRGRSVACVVTDESDPVELVARCRIGVTDVSEWLARGGWADAAPSAPAAVRDAADEARREGRGRHGPAPRGVIAG
jgi:endonuclease YncB( thermonuclease family)